MFPSTLLGTGENWTLMKTISVTEYLNYEAGKLKILLLSHYTNVAVSVFSIVLAQSVAFSVLNCIV